MTFQIQLNSRSNVYFFISYSYSSILTYWYVSILYLCTCIYLSLYYFGLSVSSAAAAAADVCVQSLPGWSGPLPTYQYSGYLNVSSTHLHYWLVEAENLPADAPVVLWLNVRGHYTRLELTRLGSLPVSISLSHTHYHLYLFLPLSPSGRSGVLILRRILLRTRSFRGGRPRLLQAGGARVSLEQGCEYAVHRSKR